MRTSILLPRTKRGIVGISLTSGTRVGKICDECKDDVNLRAISAPQSSGIGVEMGADIANFSGTECLGDAEPDAAGVFTGKRFGLEFWIGDLGVRTRRAR